MTKPLLGVTRPSNSWQHRRSLSFLYFTYGSDLWPPRMRSVCPSARVVSTTSLEGWTLRYDKPSRDGSAKANIRPDPAVAVPGVIYEIEDGERQELDSAAPGYAARIFDVAGDRALSYIYQGPSFAGRPFDWYVATVEAGAREHGLDPDSFSAETVIDPLAPGIRPADQRDLPLLQEILAGGLANDAGRYFIHPGDIAWWIYHDDPRYPDHDSIWLQDDRGFVVVDTLEPVEISVFTRQGVDRMPLVEWSQRRLAVRGEVGWVADSDAELVEALQTRGYEPGFAYRVYEMGLKGNLPEPETPDGWSLRSMTGEGEADTRRAAAHAAFESSMDPAMHLRRYLDFMRSPVYMAERDLVAVAPDGTVGAFMIWWADPSGIAEIEPFGTHPEFHRRGIGRALMYHGLARMKEAGMTVVRVCTDDDRPATHFYEACGFTDVGRLRWWKPPPSIGDDPA